MNRAPAYSIRECGIRAIPFVLAGVVLLVTGELLTGAVIFVGGSVVFLVALWQQQRAELSGIADDERREAAEFREWHRSLRPRERVVYYLVCLLIGVAFIALTQI